MVFVIGMMFSYILVDLFSMVLGRFIDDDVWVVLCYVMGVKGGIWVS